VVQHIIPLTHVFHQHGVMVSLEHHLVLQPLLLVSVRFHALHLRHSQLLGIVHLPGTACHLVVQHIIPLTHVFHQHGVMVSLEHHLVLQPLLLVSVRFHAIPVHLVPIQSHLVQPFHLVVPVHSPLGCHVHLGDERPLGHPPVLQDVIVRRNLTLTLLLHKLERLSLARTVNLDLNLLFGTIKWVVNFGLDFIRCRVDRGRLGLPLEGVGGEGLHAVSGH